MVAQLFDQVTYVGEEYSNFHDSEPIFMIGDFKIFPKVYCGIREEILTIYVTETLVDHH